MILGFHTAKLPICSKYSAILLVISSIFLNNECLFQLLLFCIFVNIWNTHKLSDIYASKTVGIINFRKTACARKFFYKHVHDDIYIHWLYIKEFLNLQTRAWWYIHWLYIKEFLNLIVTKEFIGCSCTVNNITLHNNNLNACVYVYFSMHLCHSRNIASPISSFISYQ